MQGVTAIALGIHSIFMAKINAAGGEKFHGLNFFATGVILFYRARIADRPVLTIMLSVLLVNSYLK